MTQQTRRALSKTAALPVVERNAPIHFDYSEESHHRIMVRLEGDKGPAIAELRASCKRTAHLPAISEEVDCTSTR